MKENYEFMRMPFEFRHSVINDESQVFPEYQRTNVISPFPEKTPIGMAYVPYQQWGDIYSADDGFVKGTIFPELDSPFKGGDCNFE